MAVLAIGDWVRLKRLHCGCRYGKVIQINGNRVVVRTDATDLSCMRYEVTRAQAQEPPTIYFPMRKRLPYGRYNTDSGYVLFNRDYEPLVRVSNDGSYSVCEPQERIKHQSENWFYGEEMPPWESRAVFDACVAKLPDVIINGGF
jgi:hypothetical protein